MRNLPAVCKSECFKGEGILETWSKSCEMGPCSVNRGIYRWVVCWWLPLAIPTCVERTQRHGSIQPSIQSDLSPTARKNSFATQKSLPDRPLCLDTHTPSPISHKSDHYGFKSNHHHLIFLNLSSIITRRHSSQLLHGVLRSFSL